MLDTKDTLGLSVFPAPPSQKKKHSPFTNKMKVKIKKVNSRNSMSFSKKKKNHPTI